MNRQQWSCPCGVLVAIAGGWPVAAQLCPRCGKFMAETAPPADNRSSVK